jgi:hypothetical protein
VECCELTLREIKGIREEEDLVEQTRKSRVLMNDLKRNALAMAFKIINGFDAKTLGYLGRDKKFAKLVEELKNRFETGHKKFVSEIHW